MGYGFTELRGGYIETIPDTGEKINVTEDSLLINNITKQEAIALGYKYNQDSILYKDANGFYMLKANPKNPAIERNFKKKMGKDNMNILINGFSEYFSSLKKGSHADVKFNYIEEAEGWDWFKAVKAGKDGQKNRKWIKILEIKDDQD